MGLPAVEDAQIIPPTLRVWDSGFSSRLYRDFGNNVQKSKSRIAAACLLLLVFLFWYHHGLFVQTPAKPVDPVDAILQTTPLIDGHNDFAIWIRAFRQNHIHNITESTRIDGQVDFPRLREGRLRGQFWSVYVPCPEVEDDYSDNAYGEIVHDTLQQIDLVHAFNLAFPTLLRMAASADEVWSNFAESAAISSFLGAEGLHQIGNSASILRMYHRLEMRYITLTHDCHNKYADSAGPAKPLHQGLSSAGVALLREMNRIGMIIDLSHTSLDTMRMALNTSAAPVMFSHSSSFALCPHPRNVPDDVLLALKDNGGIIMVTFYPEYLNCEEPSKASIADVADHIEHIGRLIGYEHVGIGSDFDGMAQGPVGLEHVGRYPNLIRELVQRGVGRAELELVVGRNVLRVLKRAELVAVQLAHGPPLEDDVKPMFGLANRLLSCSTELIFSGNDADDNGGRMQVLENDLCLTIPTT